MFIAQMDSESLEWIALGNTISEAKEAIRERWNENQQRLVQNGWKNQPEYYGTVKQLERDYDISITELEAGQCEAR